MTRFARLSPPEEELLVAWHRQLLANGWTPLSATRATNRIRAFARAAPGGLLEASRANVYALAEQLQEGPGASSADVNRSPGWRASIATIRAFYRWGHSSGARLGPDPTTRLVLTPSRQPGVWIRPRDARVYQRVLICRNVSLRDEAMLRLLAMGLDPADVSILRLSDVNRDAPWAIRRRAGTWLPLSDRAALSVFRYLQVRPVGQGDYLFPGRKAGQGISPSTVRGTVRRAAVAAFPRPGQAALRRRVYPAGFKHLMIARALRARVSPLALRVFTGMDRLTRLERFWTSELPDASAHRAYPYEPALATLAVTAHDPLPLSSVNRTRSDLVS